MAKKKVIKKISDKKQIKILIKENKRLSEQIELFDIKCMRKSRRISDLKERISINKKIRAEAEDTRDNIKNKYMFALGQLSVLKRHSSLFQEERLIREKIASRSIGEGESIYVPRSVRLELDLEDGSEFSDPLMSNKYPTFRRKSIY